MSEVEVLKRSLYKAETDLAMEKAENAKLLREMKDREFKAETLERDYQQLQKEYLDYKNAQENYRQQHYSEVSGMSKDIRAISSFLSRITKSEKCKDCLNNF